MSFGIGKKIGILVALPLIAFIGLAVTSATVNWQRFVAAKAIKADTELFQALSIFIHDLQKERGLSAMFLGGKLSADDLKAQRRMGDQEEVDLQNALKLVALDPASTAKLKSSFIALSDVREKTDAKQAASDMSAAYSDLLQHLIEVEVGVTRVDRLDGIETKLLSLTMLESAKENAGRLRANITNILNADVGINNLKVSMVSGLRSGVIANMDSPALLVSTEGRQSLEKFKTSSDWIKALQVIETVLLKSDQGKFGEKPAEYFTAVTASIDALGAVVKSELDSIHSECIQMNKSALRMLGLMIGLSSLIAFILLVAAWKMVSQIIVQLHSLAESLSTGASHVATTAGEVSSLSAELSSATTEQAASLQETVASIEEVSAMVSKNAENAKNSQESAVVSQQVAKRGKATLQEMMVSMEAINENNSQIKHQMDESNQQMSEIVAVITEIGKKTLVINDIVFQTKLLSFNASVEAARAGEHGKGFAVVAEEVGNLAQMSGNAAKEISQMLVASIEKVEGIVHSTQKNVESLVVAGKGRVQEGTKIAERCDGVLNEIVNNVENLSLMISEIATACAEQSQGVQEINKAIIQLDQVTHKNASVSQHSAHASDSLTTEVKDLRSMEGTLASLVSGSSQEKVKMTAAKVAVAKVCPSSVKIAAQHSNVVPIKTAEVKKTVPPVVKSEIPLKKAVGTHVGLSESVPSHDDKRFEEV